MFITLTSMDDGKEYDINPSYIIIMTQEENITTVIINYLVPQKEKVTSWGLRVEKTKEEIKEMIEEINKKYIKEQVIAHQISAGNIMNRVFNMMEWKDVGK